MLNDASPSQSRSVAANPFALYDGLLWGDALDDDQARDLRAMARIFDIEAHPGMSLAGLWAQVRPLLAAVSANERRS